MNDNSGRKIFNHDKAQGKVLYSNTTVGFFFKQQPNDAALTNGLIITTLMLLNESNGGCWQKANLSGSTVDRQQHLLIESVTYLFHTHGVYFNSRGEGKTVST